MLCGGGGLDVGVEEDEETREDGGVAAIEVAEGGAAFDAEGRSLGGFAQGGGNDFPGRVFQAGAERDFKLCAERERVSGREGAAAFAQPNELTGDSGREEEGRGGGGFADLFGAYHFRGETQFERALRIERARGEEKLDGRFRRARETRERQERDDEEAVEKRGAQVGPE